MYINNNLYKESDGLNRLKNFIIPNSEYTYYVSSRKNGLSIRRYYNIGTDTHCQALHIRCTEKQHDKIISFINSTIDYY